jgi:hypothetical protein
VVNIFTGIADGIAALLGAVDRTRQGVLFLAWPQTLSPQALSGNGGELGHSKIEAFRPQRHVLVDACETARETRRCSPLRYRFEYQASR